MPIILPKKNPTMEILNETQLETSHLKGFPRAGGLIVNISFDEWLRLVAATMTCRT